MKLRLRSLVAITCVSLATTAEAEIKILAAKITEGDLVVMGSLDTPDTEVTLDGLFTEKSDPAGRFTFRIIYRPATCIVDLQARASRRAVVIGNCGQMGPKGDPGARGLEGERGSPGPAGPAGPAERASTWSSGRHQAKAPGGLTGRAIVRRSDLQGFQCHRALSGSDRRQQLCFA